MAAQRSVKARGARPLLVAVISSPQEFIRATRLRQKPDLVELRLDALAPMADKLEVFLASLRAPRIITARHPSEGGHNNLSARRRLDLLLRFLPHAAYVDVELRAARQLGVVLETAEHRDISRIISVHELRGTPSIDRLHTLADAAEALGADVFKIATRTDTADELARLVAFFDSRSDRLSISAMGMGTLGREARRLLAGRGSALNYAHLGNRGAEGQYSLAEMRRLLRTKA